MAVCNARSSENTVPNIENHISDDLGFVAYIICLVLKLAERYPK